jgi:hypothetical protein
LLDKYSDAQPRGSDGRWINSNDTEASIGENTSTKLGENSTQSAAQTKVAIKTKDFNHACRVLRLDPNEASDILHDAKYKAGLSGGDNCHFDLDNGDIFFNGEWIGNLHG